MEISPILTYRCEGVQKGLFKWRLYEEKRVAFTLIELLVVIAIFVSLQFTLIEKRVYQHHQIIYICPFSQNTVIE
jgi:prepilin-type N-terminal cleavage/methylation domain-containing protein